MGFGLGLIQSGRKQAGKDSDNGYDDEKLHKSETAKRATLLRRRTRAFGLVYDLHHLILDILSDCRELDCCCSSRCADNFNRYVVSPW